MDPALCVVFDSNVVIADYLLCGAMMSAPDDHDRELYRERNVVERLINRLKRYRAVATRYDKLAASYLATITIACIFERI